MALGREVAKGFVPGYSRGPMFTLPKDRRAATPMTPPEESELIKFCENLFHAAKLYRDDRLGMMDRWRSFRSWYLKSGGMTPDGQKSRTYVNMIFEKIEKISADLTEGRPDFLFLPHTLADVPMTEVLNDAVPWVWDSQDMQRKYATGVKGACLYGTYYHKVFHDPRFINQGSVERVREIPPWYIFPAPYATEVEETPWIIEISVRTVGEIESDYGVTVKPELDIREFVPDIEDDMAPAPVMGSMVKPASQTNMQGEQTSEGAGYVEGIPDSYLSLYGRSGLVIQKELWIRDGRMKESFEVEDDGMEVPTVVKRKMAEYPNGRVISWANGRLLYDTHNPYKDGRFPYVVFKDISIPDFWYGQGEVEQLIDLQLLHDDTNEILKVSHIFNAVGRMLLDKRTGVREDEISGNPNEIIVVEPGTIDGVKWLPASPPPAEIYTYLQALQSWADLVSGSHDVNRGINPTGVTAGKALQTLQAASSSRIRQRLLDMEAALVREVRLIASRIQQFWPADMLVRVTGDDPNAVKRPGSFGAIRIDDHDREATFNIRVNAAANSPSAKEAQFQKLVMLAQMGIPVPPTSMIEAADLPQEKKILREMAMAQVMSGVPPEAPAPRQPSREDFGVVSGQAGGGRK